MSFFGTGLTLIVTTCLLALTRYVQRLLPPLPARHKRRLWGVALLLWLLFLAGRHWGGGHQEGLLAVALDLGAMHLLGSLPLLLLSFLLADLLHLLARLAGLRQPQRLLWLGPLLGLPLILLAHIQGLAPPVLSPVRVERPDLPPRLEGLKLALLCDTHLGESGLDAAWLAARVEQIHKARPDLILLAGDMLEQGCRSDEVVPILRRLSAPLGVWAVRGNHDSPRAGRPDHAGQIYQAAGIPLLEDRWVSPAPGLVLAGTRDLTRARRHSADPRSHLEQALSGRPQASVTLLLSHTPDLVETAARLGVDLMVCGHTHGGQIWPFGHLVSLRYPHLEGLPPIGPMSLLIPRGAGTWGPRMRLWGRGRIPLITLARTRPGTPPPLSP